MWIRKNIAEIRDDPALRLYGFFLAVTHLLTLLFWRVTQDLEPILTSPEPICWPFWEECHRFRFFSPEGVRPILGIYLALSLVSANLFLKRQWIGAAWWFFLATNLLKLGIVVQDFQLRLNQHYMAGLACLVFLFLPQKRRFLKILIVLFYFWAGLLKLNTEWLSGAALYRPLWLFSGLWIPVVCAYVVVLEFVLVWGVLSRRGSLFWTAFVQLLIFHIFSWPVVGFFYPTLMFCLLTIFPLTRYLKDDRKFERISRPAVIFLAVYSLAQFIPTLMPGDSALTGEGRLFGVHMFDSLIRCEAHAMLKHPDGTVEKKNLYRPIAARIHCDPIVYFNRARALCRGPEHGTQFVDFDLSLRSRKTSEQEVHQVIALKDFCASNPTYSVWSHNFWINAE